MKLLTPYCLNLQVGNIINPQCLKHKKSNYEKNCCDKNWKLDISLNLILESEGYWYILQCLTLCAVKINQSDYFPSWPGIMKYAESDKCKFKEACQFKL